jgi:phosphate-selective porin OprO/OprP
MATLGSVPGWSQNQPAGNDRAAMEQEIQELRKRIDELDQKLRASNSNQQPNAAQTPEQAQAAAAAAANSVARTATGRVATATGGIGGAGGEVTAAGLAAGAAPGPGYVSADTTGFTIKSPDGNYLLKIGADLQVDNRTYTGAASTSLIDNTLLRRVRPTFSGTVYKYVDYFLRPDFGQGTTIIYDAYVQLNYIPHFNLRVGKFKPPVGLERLQSDDDTSFIERGLPTLLVPSRDIGYQLGGDLLNRRVGYQVGVFNGVVDNSLSDAAVSNHRDYAARVFLTPFAPSDNKWIKGVGAGIGATGGNVDGLGLPAYKTVGQNTFFSFASGVSEAGHRTRLAPQAYYYMGPFGLLTEYTLAEEGLQKGLVRHDVAFRAWQVEASYILTGETKSFGSPIPKHPFDPMHNSWGAIELAARTGEFSVEHGIFSYGFATPTATPRLAREYVGGANWYLNRLVRISLDYGVTGFEGGAVNGNRLTERVILFRFQLNFI